MVSWLTIQAKLYAAGAIALAVLGFFVRLKVVTAQRDRAVVVADTMKARVHVQQTQKKIAREEKKRLVSRRADIIREIQKDEENFKGLDNLNKPNDF